MKGKSNSRHLCHDKKSPSLPGAQSFYAKLQAVVCQQKPAKNGKAFVVHKTVL
jgi:hypothetical protein